MTDKGQLSIRGLLWQMEQCVITVRFLICMTGVLLPVKTILLLQAPRLYECLKRLLGALRLYLRICLYTQTKGSQFTSAEFAQHRQRYNTPMERYYDTLKTELIYQYWFDREELIAILKL